MYPQGILEVLEWLTLALTLAYMTLMDYDDIKYRSVDDTYFIGLIFIVLPLAVVRFLVFGVPWMNIVATLMTLATYAALWVAGRFYIIIGEADLILLSIIAIAFPEMRLNSMVVDYSLDVLIVASLASAIFIVPNMLRNIVVALRYGVDLNFRNALFMRYVPDTGEWMVVTIPMIPMIHISMVLVVALGSPMNYLVFLLKYILVGTQGTL